MAEIVIKASPNIRQLNPVGSEEIMVNRNSTGDSRPRQRIAYDGRDTVTISGEARMLQMQAQRVAVSEEETAVESDAL